MLANYPALRALEAALDQLGDGQSQDLDAEAAFAIAKAAVPQSPIGILTVPAALPLASE